MLAASSLQTERSSRASGNETPQEAMMEVSSDLPGPVNGHSLISSLFELESISGTWKQDLFGIGGIFEQNSFIKFATHSIGHVHPADALLVMD
jgi:hypothetical protein